MAAVAKIRKTFKHLGQWSDFQIISQNCFFGLPYTKIAKNVPIRQIKVPTELKTEKPLNDISSEAKGLV